MDFDTDRLLLKANHMIKSILYAYSDRDLKRVRHFMSEGCYQALLKHFEEDDRLHRRMHYDEVRVTSLLNRMFETEEYYNIEVIASCNAYIWSEVEGQDAIEGSQERKSSFGMKALFVKRIDAQVQDVVRCQGCGSSFNIKQNGECPNCGRVYDLDKFDFIIQEMDF